VLRLSSSNPLISMPATQTFSAATDPQGLTCQRAFF
jgi:hypothetical protein